MDLGLFGGWSGATSVLVKVVIFYFYAVLLLRLAGKRTIATTTVFDFVSTVAMGTIIGTTIISSSIALSDGIIGLTALVALQWLVAYASAHSASIGSPRTRLVCFTTVRASSTATYVASA